jgi:glycosyltransferase involved in cell wall biosynthesis
MRIFVVEQDGAGGLAHYAYQLCTALSETGADVTLVTGRRYELGALPHSFTVDPRIGLWSATGTTLPESRIASTLVMISRKLRRPFRAIRYAYEWHRLTNHLIEQRPDIVQLSVIRFPFQAIFLRRMERAGLTLTQICHEFEKRELGRFTRMLGRRWSRTLYDSFTLIFLHGDANRDRFHEVFDIPHSRTRSIKHGDESMFHSVGPADPAPPPSTPTALFFGGLRPSKGIEDLIDAWELVRYEVEARLMICGEPAGVDPAELRARADRAGVAVSVDIDPTYQPMEAVPGLMRSATVAVLPYRSATASGVLQLAYAFGTPVVATAVGALAEDVEHGVTGLLVPPGDVDALARALIKLLSAPEEAHRMGEAAQEATSRFSWSAIASGIHAEYEALQ